jgi:hypothetical protein
MRIRLNIDIIVIAIIIFGGLYLIFQGGVLVGAMKERERKVCVSEFELSTYKDTLEAAQTICIGSQQYKNQELQQCQAETEKWKKNYSWLKLQATSTE